MKKFFGKVWKYGKAVVVPAVGAAVPLVASGTFGPKAQAVAVALVTIWGVFSRRPQDEHPSDAPEAPKDQLGFDFEGK